LHCRGLTLSICEFRWLGAGMRDTGQYNFATSTRPTARSCTMPRMSQSFVRSLLACAAVALVVVGPGRAQFTWTNAAGGNWSAPPTNWSPVGPPPSSAATTLTFGPSATYTATNDLGAFALNSLTFSHASGTA